LLIANRSLNGHWCRIESDLNAGLQTCHLLVWTWPDDVIRPRPLKPSALFSMASTRVPLTSQRISGRGELSCRERTDQGNDFELIPTVKIEARHPVQYAEKNHLSAFFLEKRPLTGKSIKFCSESFH